MEKEIKRVERTGFDVCNEKEIKTPFYLHYEVRISTKRLYRIADVIVPAELPDEEIKKRVIKEALRLFRECHPGAKVEWMKAEFVDGNYFAHRVTNIRPEPPAEIEIKY